MSGAPATHPLFWQRVAFLLRSPLLQALVEKIDRLLGGAAVVIRLAGAGARANENDGLLSALRTRRPTYGYGPARSTVNRSISLHGTHLENKYPYTRTPSDSTCTPDNQNRQATMAHGGPNTGDNIAAFGTSTRQNDPTSTAVMTHAPRSVSVARYTPLGRESVAVRITLQMSPSNRLLDPFGTQAHSGP
jgi:hypothetical protein